MPHAVPFAGEERLAAAFLEDLVVLSFDGLMEALFDLLLDVGLAGRYQDYDLVDVFAVEEVIYDL